MNTRTRPHHFGMDDGGERTRLACGFQRPRWKHLGNVFDGAPDRAIGTSRAPFHNPQSEFLMGNLSRQNQM